MHRTNLYLTPDQERALDTRASAAGMSRSALVRRIIDEALSPVDSPDVAAEEAFGRLADAYHDVVGRLFDDDPDLRIET